MSTIFQTNLQLLEGDNINFEMISFVIVSLFQNWRTQIKNSSKYLFIDTKKKENRIKPKNENRKKPNPIETKNQANLTKNDSFVVKMAQSCSDPIIKSKSKLASFVAKYGCKLSHLPSSLYFVFRI